MIILPEGIYGKISFANLFLRQYQQGYQHVFN